MKNGNEGTEKQYYINPTATAKIIKLQDDRVIFPNVYRNQRPIRREDMPAVRKVFPSYRTFWKNDWLRAFKTMVLCWNGKWLKAKHQIILTKHRLFIIISNIRLFNSQPPLQKKKDLSLTVGQPTFLWNHNSYHTRATITNKRKTPSHFWGALKKKHKKMGNLENIEHWWQKTTAWSICPNIIPFVLSS